MKQLLEVNQNFCLPQHSYMQLNFKTEYLTEVMHISFPTVYIFVVELVL